MKYCHGLKDDDFKTKIFELDAQPGWEDAKQVIGIYVAASLLKEGLKKKKINSKGQVIHIIVGSKSNSPAYSPGEKRNKEKKEEEARAEEIEDQEM